jgi:hypothetical protein
MTPADPATDVVHILSTANRRPKPASLRFEAPADAETRSLMKNVG